MEALKGITRKATGSTQTRRLRQSGLTPGIIYGHGEANVPFAVSTHDLQLAMQHGERLVKMTLDDVEGNYLIKDVQRDAFDQGVLHVDFTRVNLDEVVQVEVPIALKGTPAGEAEGGILTPGIVELTIEVTVTAIPDEIVVRVEGLKAGGAIRVADLPAIEGVTILTDDDAIVATCPFPTEEAVEEAPAEEGAEPVEPEVIGRRKAEEEEEEES
ncbi:MAG: 50S ribosomal protein L25 [Planctomycetes bacterium]|nr:50S ribosomal protein L25 [Planctomycetota bacterium]